MLKGRLLIAAGSITGSGTAPSAIDVEIEEVVVVVDGELLQHKLHPLRVEGLTPAAAKSKDEHKGPLVRLFVKAPTATEEDNDGNGDANRATCEGEDRGGSKRKQQRKG